VDEEVTIAAGDYARDRLGDLFTMCDQWSTYGPLQRRASMAGYIIYSLDWPKFSAMIERPTSAQLGILAQGLVEERDNLGGEFDEGDPVRGWPTDAESLAPVVAERLARSDWYGDLSEQGKQLWESAFYVTCMRADDLGIDFRVDSDGVYWDVINLIVQRLGDRPETPGKSAMSRFGTVPFRCSAPPRQRHSSSWTPMHSMHPPDEVQRMLAELRSAAPAIEAAKDPDVREQFAEELLPALEGVAGEGRLLFYPGRYMRRT
jgi:hypothetical protein